jgi:hypothetical protein
MEIYQLDNCGINKAGLGALVTGDYASIETDPTSAVYGWTPPALPTDLTDTAEASWAFSILGIGLENINTPGGTGPWGDAQDQIGAFYFELAPSYKLHPSTGTLPVNAHLVNNSLNELSYSVNWGDGTTDILLTHVYKYRGTYSVVITSTGKSATDTTNFTVTAMGDPQAMLQWSNDGGYTYGAERWESMGKQGMYKTRMHWHSLGSARDRVFKLIITDAVRVRLINAQIDVESEKE